MIRLRTLLPAAATAILSACTTVGPDYHLPAEAAINRPAAQGAFVDTDGTEGIDTHGTVPAQWWKLYDDSLLNQLEIQALASNADVRAAGDNLRRAAAVYAQARNAGGLGESANLNVQRSEISAQSLLQTERLPVFNLAVGGIQVDYEFDLFGKLRRAAEAAGADAQAAQAALHAARISVVAEVVRDYTEVCHANHELAIAQHSVALQRRSQQVADALYEAGRGILTDVTQARAQVALLQAAIPTLQARKQTSEYALAALLGNTPGQLPTGVETCIAAPQLTQPIPVGNGMSLLARRPDINAAERRLAAATARIGVATAELYPDVSLGANAGTNGLLDDFGKPVAQTWGIGPLITWTFPTATAHARIHAAEAGADTALDQFDQTVLDALRDTQSALTVYVQALKRQTALDDAVTAAREAAAQNRQLYQGGRAPYLTSLDAERTLAQAESQAAQNEAEITRDQVNLFLALGGGWQPADGDSG